MQQKAKPTLTNLQKRILVSAIYFPLVLLSAYDTRVFCAILTLVCGCCWHEYLSFRSHPAHFKDWLVHFSKIVVGSAPVLMMAVGLPFELGVALICLVVQVKVVVDLVNGDNLAKIIEGLSFYFFGALYLTLLFSLVALIQARPSGREAIWFLFFVVAMTDTGGYFCGRFFGRHAFFQHISPSKTQEGAWGGIAAAALVGILYYLIFPRYDFITPNLFMCILLAVILGLASIFGDLFESLLKRSYGVKDSGHLMPGHGGVLDRFDGIIAAAIPLFFFVALRGGFR